MSTDKLHIILTTTSVALFALLFFSGCGDALLGTGCSYDSDCLADQYCVANQCAAQCSDDEDCSSGTHCEVYQRPGEVDPVQVCLDMDSMDNNGLRCTSDEQCRLMLGAENARCGMHDRCVLVGNDGENSQNGANQENQANQNGSNNDDPAPSERIIVIVEQLDEDGQILGDDDELDGNGDEDDANAADPDANSEESPPVRPLRLGAVVVRDDDGRAIGYGRLVDLAPAQMDDQDNPGLASPDPRLPLDDSETCVDEPSLAPFASLGGPGGRAYIELVDERERILETDTLRWVQVIGDGLQCPLGDANPDFEELPYGEYRVLICVQDIEDELAQEDSCNLEYSGPFGGFADIEVTFEN